MTRWFVGLDLAWSANHPSGIAVLEAQPGGAALAWAGALRTTEEMADALRALEGDWLLGIDAPIVVTNATGMRPSDRGLTRLYGRFHAGAHPTNLGLLRGRVRAKELLDAIPDTKVQILDTPPPARIEGRWAFETYPHAASVELFGTARIFKYKHGPVAARREELGKFAAALDVFLRRRQPALAASPAWRALQAVAIAGLRGQALKAHEDTLDAVLCAYVALHTWWWGAARTRAVGDPATGAVLLPRRRRDLPAPA